MSRTGILEYVALILATCQATKRFMLLALKTNVKFNRFEYVGNKAPVVDAIQTLFLAVFHNLPGGIAKVHVSENVFLEKYQPTFLKYLSAYSPDVKGISFAKICLTGLNNSRCLKPRKRFMGVHEIFES